MARENKSIFEAMLARFSSAIEGIDDAFFDEENIDALRPTGIPFGIPGHGTAYIFRYFTPAEMVTLPYYHLMPFVICLSRTSETMTGLNLFYLPPRIRERIVDIYLRYVNDDSVKGRSTLLFDVIKRQKVIYSAIKPAIKQYQIRRMGPIAFRIAPRYWKELYLEEPSDVLKRGFLKKPYVQVQYLSRVKIIQNLLNNTEEE
tara:strand:- start:739 stop:1344 length:606 start_codon:yes stop_codon:yes gene_type:complete